MGKTDNVQITNISSTVLTKSIMFTNNRLKQLIFFANHDSGA